jgi:hypothetical protein
MHGNTEDSTNDGKAGDNSVREPAHQVDDKLAIEVAESVNIMNQKPKPNEAEIDQTQ